MKKTISGLKSAKICGFTLVELLVVIAIIAILAGVILQAASYAIKTAQRAKAFNLATQIQSSVINYYTEYSLYPDDTTAFPAGADYLIPDTDAANWKNLLIALCGNNNPGTGAAATSTVPNTRGIAFLSLKVSDLYSTTVIAPKNPLPPDATHLYFNIAIDNDYDGVLGVAPSAIKTLPNFATMSLTATAAANATAAAGGGITSAGCAVWANCSAGSATIAPNNYVRTY